MNVPCPGNDDGVYYHESVTEEGVSYGVLPEPGKEGSYVTSEHSLSHEECAC